MSNAETRQCSNLDENLSAIDESETNDKKAYETRIENQPFVLGPGTERFLDGKTPLSPLSRATMNEGKFEALDLDLNVQPGQKKSTKSPLDKSKNKRSFQDEVQKHQNIGHTADVICSSPTRKLHGRTVVIFGKNDWFNGHLIVRFLEEGYSVRFAVENHTVQNTKKAPIADFLGIISARFNSTRLLEKEKYGKLSIHYIDINRYFNDTGTFDDLLKGSSFVIDNGFLSECGIDGGIYNLLRAIQRINTSTPFRSRISKLLVTVSRSVRPKFHKETFIRFLSSCLFMKDPHEGQASYCMSYNDIRCEVSRLSKLVGVDAVFLSYGQLVGPVFYNASLSEAGLDREEPFYSATTMPHMLQQTSTMSILSPRTESILCIVDIRDVTKAYVRCLECPAAYDKHYHISKRPVTSLHLWKLYRKTFMPLLSCSLSLHGIIEFLVPPMWHLLHFDSKIALAALSKSAYTMQEKVSHDLGIKPRPSHVTIRAMVEEEKVLKHFQTCTISGPSWSQIMWRPFQYFRLSEGKAFVHTLLKCTTAGSIIFILFRRFVPYKA